MGILSSGFMKYLFAALLFAAACLAQTPPPVDLFPPQIPNDPLFAPTNMIAFGAGERRPIGQWALLSYTNQSRYYENGSPVDGTEEEGAGDAGFARAWNIQSHATNVLVAMLEKCFCYTNHPDAPVMRPVVKIAQTGSGDHGSHMTAIIAAKSNNGMGMCGAIRDGADILPIQVYYVEDYANGVHLAIDAGAKIICYSTGGLPYPAVSNAMRRAYQSNVLVICAAPNNGGELINDYPGAWSTAWSNIFVVAASRRGERWYNGSSYSTNLVDGLMPGREIVTLAGPIGYTYVGGSSPATAHAVAEAALIMARHPDWTIYQVAEAMRATATHTPGYDGRSKSGGLNVLAALLWNPTMVRTQVHLVTQAGATMDGPWVDLWTNTVPAVGQGFFRLRIE